MSEEKLRAVTMFYDKDGCPVGRSVLSPSENTARALCIVPPDEVFPVIFVPGIMGSNLRFKVPIEKFNGGKDISWRPDSPKYTAWTFANLKPAKRREVLNPENTLLDDRAKIPDSKLPAFKSADPEVRENWKKEYARRGWGTVMLDSYGEILYHLELHLNGIYDDNYALAAYWQERILGVKADTGNDGNSKHPWGTMTGHTALTEGDLKEKLGDKYWFPVHAAGYNWLRSNDEAGKALALQIDTIIGHYKKLGFPCEKVILVTHSMGGLAARAACHPEIGNAAANVAGIVHGEQPAIGAAAAYKRMHTGFEAGGLFNIVSLIVARALGWSGKEVTAVLSNAPGGLELLPTKLYPPGWLRVQHGEKDMMPPLPVSNPYAEIYAEKDKWWRLMNPEWIDPGQYASDPEALDQTWTDYLKRLKSAEKFHDKLGAYYHPLTHAHYGADERNKAWTTFTWKLKESSSGKTEMGADALTVGPMHNDALGKIKVRSNGIDASFTMLPPDKPGDGTVPEVSGAASASNAAFATKMTGYEHQGSYENPWVKDVTAYSVARIARASEGK